MNKYNALKLMRAGTFFNCAGERSLKKCSDCGYEYGVISRWHSIISGRRLSTCPG